MLSPLTRLQAKSQKLADLLLEPQIMMLWAHKLGLLTAQKARYKKEKKLFTLSHYMKSMLSTPDLKAFWPYFLAQLEKSPNKSENKSIRRCLNGEKREKLR